MARELTREEIEDHLEAGENFHVPSTPIEDGDLYQESFCEICGAVIESEDGGKTWVAA